MTLPPPSRLSWSDWKRNYKVTTPTFQLTAVEKPDMSPFLVHMTGKDAIHSILNGKKATQPIPYGAGYLKANVPEYDQSVIQAPVVCFTESPTFALDFFRYRSFDRWKADQRYGIGFDKTIMAEVGVRPVVYVDESLRKNLIYLAKRLKENNGTFANEVRLNDVLIDTLTSLLPIAFPLLEDRKEQGFIWEREWRHPNPEGFVFSHQAIKIICCPEREEPKIREILGDVADEIQFIRAWREYDDVTSYLTRQKPVWQAQAARYKKAATLQEAASRLRMLIRQQRTAYNSLESYSEYIEYLGREMRRATEEQNLLAREISELEKELKSVEAELKKQKQDNQGSSAPDNSEGDSESFETWESEDVWDGEEIPF